jgi:methionyl-tRNA formyltransferase
LVLHASALPRGRGWSPHVWAILEGAHEIEVCLLAAEDPVDNGDVWLRQRFFLEGHELFPEINEKLFCTELSLMTQAVEQFDQIKPEAQQGDPGPLLRRRTPEDSQLDPLKTIAEQFDLLRVADPDRYPAFMDFRGKRYWIKIEKAST